MRALILSRYGDAGASSRIRIFQYLPYLAEAGADFIVQPLLDDGYLAELYASRRRDWSAVARAYVSRLGAVRSASEFDLVWLEKECWPWVPALLDPGLLRVLARYVVDYDDAVFHNYDQARGWMARALFGDKIQKVMRHSALVVTGNNYLAAHARAAGAKRVEIIPSVVDPRRYRTKTAWRAEKFVVGWIGSPATQHFLQEILPVLEAVLDPERDRLVTIGGRFGAPLLKNHENREWSADTEAEAIAEFDVGVMPLVDQPFERGKCGFKLIQYMAAGLPVIASPVGVNREIVEHGVNGYLAKDGGEWCNALRELRARPDIRKKMGAFGRRRVEDEYSIEVTGPRMVELLERATRD